MAKAYTLVGGQGGNEYTGANPIIPSDNPVIIPNETLFKSDLVVKGDSGLISSNIIQGATIFGVVGSAVEVENVGGEGIAYIGNESGYKKYKMTNIQNK